MGCDCQLLIKENDDDDDDDDDDYSSILETAEKSTRVWKLETIRPHYGCKIPPKPQFWGRE